jgi:GNAT superfamily N-acetyltransferase
MNSELYRALMTGLYGQRRGWMGDGKYWVLTTIVTREPWRGKGAASRLLEWGLEQGRRDGVPVFLEAAPGATGLYQKHGWREVGRSVTEAKGKRVEMCRMKVEPA